MAGEGFERAGGVPTGRSPAQRPARSSPPKPERLRRPPPRRDSATLRRMIPLIAVITILQIHRMSMRPSYPWTGSRKNDRPIRQAAS
jgi:hypothetical protein